MGEWESGLEIFQNKSKRTREYYESNPTSEGLMKFQEMNKALSNPTNKERGPTKA